MSPPGARGRLVEAFARAVLRRVPARELEDADPVSTAVAIVDAFDFVDGRRPGDIRVRLVDPRVTVDGWHSTGTVVQVSCDDRQFIVTTVREELHRLGHKVTRLLHPVFGSERAADGRLSTILPARDAPHRESFLQAELGGRVAPEARRGLVAGIRAVLDDVFAATGDFLAMREQVSRAAAGLRGHAALRYPADEVAEGADLLEWLLDDNFVLEGCCRRVGDEVLDALGILTDPGAPLRLDAGATPESDQPLRIVRTAEISTVHRQVPMHCIDVAEVGPDGAVAGTFRVVGVFSRKAAAEPAVDIPVLRFKLRRILELEDVVEGGHDETMLVSLFQVLPKEELFEADVASLRQVVVGLAAAEQRSDVQVVLHVEPADHTVSALLSIPQELYSTALRRRIERFLAAQLDGTRVDANVSLGDGAEVIVRLVVQVDGPLPEPPLHSIEREVRLLCRTWDEELTEALVERVGEGRGTRLAHAWAEWFPAAYRGAVRPAGAVDDVLQLDALSASGGDVAVVLRPSSRGQAHARLEVFSRGQAVELSRFLPIIESLGLWAVEEVPYALGAGEDRAHLHDFSVTDPTGRPLDVDRDGPRLAEAALAMWDGRAEVDPLNRLVLRARLPWDDVAVLRAYRRYRSQVGTTFTTEYVDDVLVENAAISRTIVELFAARFDPVRAAGSSIAEELRRRVVDGCDAVPRLDHDRILRGFLALVDATLRTNRYLHPGRGAGSTHLALKIDSGAVPDVPRPVPYREIFVYGPAVEGVHLRWGPVARGGIRWSERPDDYRSEVLGLMRAQVLKNALIVPTGAKGGFVVRRARYGGADIPVDGGVVQRAYEIFVTSLLEVTDNVVGDRVVPVPRRRDGDDPYLVVAADRGTATFSDVANRLSQEHGFWLGDAFASGGSSGYDHKELGITARGAWVAVRHHFAELDIDLGGDEDRHGDTEPVTVAGIGDMSGDVFGNAMLRSDRIRLVAAFDHRDIFLDPDPDPAASYRERARLFALPRSSWQDYDRALHQPRRRRVVAARQAHPDRSRGPGRPAPRRRGRPPVAARAHPGHPPGAGGTALRRRHRHLRAGRRRARPRHRRPGQRRGAGDGVAGAGPGGGGGGQPGLHPAGPHRVRPAGRAHQHRRHRQLGRRRHLRPRGQPQDPPPAGGGVGRDHPRGAGRPPDRGVRRRGGRRPARQRPPEPGPQPVAGRQRGAGRGHRAVDGGAGGGGRARPGGGGAADHRGDGGPGPGGGGADPARAGRPHGRVEAEPVRPPAGRRTSPTRPRCGLPWWPTSPLAWPPASTTCSTATACAGSWSRRWWPTRWSTAWARRSRPGWPATPGRTRPRWRPPGGSPEGSSTPPPGGGSSTATRSGRCPWSPSR